jgi:hypothetical protein
VHIVAVIKLDQQAKRKGVTVHFEFTTNVACKYVHALAGLPMLRNALPKLRFINYTTSMTLFLLVVEIVMWIYYHKIVVTFCA